jgi:hypothetical protein
MLVPPSVLLQLYGYGSTVVVGTKSKCYGADVSNGLSTCGVRRQVRSKSRGRVVKREGARVGERPADEA